eukprot:74791-Rhodomonas_salina.7
MYRSTYAASVPGTRRQAAAYNCSKKYAGTGLRGGRTLPVETNAESSSSLAVIRSELCFSVSFCSIKLVGHTRSTYSTYAASVPDIA